MFLFPIHLKSLIIYKTFGILSFFKYIIFVETSKFKNSMKRTWISKDEYT